MLPSAGLFRRSLFINFPAIAYRTFQQFKHDLQLWKLYKAMFKKIKKQGNPLKRAKLVHREIEEQMTQLFKDDVVQENVKCGKGCTFCCHRQVSVTRDEAELLAQNIIDGVDVDLEKLYLQSKAGNKAGEWYKLDHEARGCVFLGDEGECKVYEDRLSVCRTNNVISDPANCSTADGVEKSVRLLNTYASDMIIMAHFENSKENGALPLMLFKALDNRVQRQFKDLTK